MTKLDLDLGYVLQPERRASEPGYSGLSITLCDTPSHRHFDPALVRLLAAAEDGSLQTLTAEHPWSGAFEYRVCAGQFDVIDQLGKHLDVFTYGGRVFIESHETQTLVKLDSPAPLLLCQGTHTIACLLAQETEILLAQRRAAWEPDVLGFERRLSAADPLELYVACLETITQRFQSIPQNDEFIVQFKHMLKFEAQAGRQLLSAAARVVTLEDLV